MKYLILLSIVSSYIIFGQNKTNILYLALNDAIKKALELNWDVQLAGKDTRWLKLTMRLRPILMTTFAMIFGMVPVALGLGEGAEFRSPMGQAVIGGLVTSTLLTLFIVPVVYSILDDLGEKNVFGFIGRLFSKKKKEPVLGK